MFYKVHVQGRPIRKRLIDTVRTRHVRLVCYDMSTHTTPVRLQDRCSHGNRAVALDPARPCRRNDGCREKADSDGFLRDEGSPGLERGAAGGQLSGACCRSITTGSAADGQ